MEIIYTAIITILYVMGGFGFGKIAADATGREGVNFIIAAFWPISAVAAAIAFKRGM